VSVGGVFGMPLNPKEQLSARGSAFPWGWSKVYFGRIQTDLRVVSIFCERGFFRQHEVV
jgi:hypothetical protein